MHTEGKQLNIWKYKKKNTAQEFKWEGNNYKTASKMEVDLYMIFFNRLTLTIKLTKLIM